MGLSVSVCQFIYLSVCCVVTILELELEPVIGVEHDGRLFITKKSEDISDM